MAAKHQPDDQLVGPLTHLQNRPSISVPLLACQACSTATLHHKDIISDLPLVFDSIPELCNSSGPLIPTRMVLISKLTSSVKLGHSCQTLHPLLDLYLGTDPDSTHALVDLLSPWFSTSDKFSLTWVGSQPSYDLSLVEGRSC